MAFGSSWFHDRDSDFNEPTWKPCQAYSMTTCKLLEQPGGEGSTISWLEEEVEGLRIRSIPFAYFFLDALPLLLPNFFWVMPLAGLHEQVSAHNPTTFGSRRGEGCIPRGKRFWC